MEKLKISFPDFWGHLNVENIFLIILRKYFDVVEDNINPDVIIYSIYNSFKDAPKYKCKRILYFPENYRPSRFGIAGKDYICSISHDPHSDTNFRLPMWQYYMILKPYYKDMLYNKIKHKSFDRFCSFIVSNAGNVIRNGMYSQMSQYKMVHSYGKYMTNAYELQKIDTAFWRDGKEKFFSKISHKFGITFENSSYPYYCTEKLEDTFLAGSIPIYWGDFKIHEDFNEKAFINVNRLSIPGSIDLVKKMDNDPGLFDSMYNEPIFTEDQKKKLEENIEAFENYLITIIKK